MKLSQMLETLLTNTPPLSNPPDQKTTQPRVVFLISTAGRAGSGILAYMKNKPDYWFKRRRYGWGWTPVTRQGWLSVLVFMVVIIGAAVYLLPEKPEVPTSLQLVTYLLVFLSAIFILVGISYAKGPAPRWRWGSTPDNNPDEDI